MLWAAEKFWLRSRALGNVLEKSLPEKDTAAAAAILPVASYQLEKAMKGVRNSGENAESTV